MKRFLISIIFLLFPTYFVNSQTNEQLLLDFKNLINQDSVLVFLEELCGVREIKIDGEYQRIDSRYIFSKSNELAAKYIEQKLIDFGYSPQRYNCKNKYRTSDSVLAKIENVTVLKQGSSDSDKLIVVGAHYDGAVEEGGQTADDNGSGVAAVLEIARNMINYETQYDILFAFFDDEETGMSGSKFISDSLKELGKEDVCCINIDMIGYTRVFEFATYVYYDSRFERNIELAEKAIEIEDFYNLETEVLASDTFYIRKTYAYRIFNASSDAYSFGESGFPAVNIMERSETTEINPCYHDSCDKISMFNFKYYMSNIYLGAGMAASEAGLSQLNEVDSLSYDVGIIEVYPNPANEYVELRYKPKYSLPTINGFEVVIMDVLGRDLITFKLDIYEDAIRMDISNLLPGVYFLKIIGLNSIIVRKLVISR